MTQVLLKVSVSLGMGIDTVKEGTDKRSEENFKKGECGLVKVR